jgi:hypothetical protein
LYARRASDEVKGGDIHVERGQVQCIRTLAMVYARTIYKAAGMLTYLVVGDDAKSHGGNVKRISDKVDDIPHVVRVLLKAHVPQLLNFTPNQTCGILSKYEN